MQEILNMPQEPFLLKNPSGILERQQVPNASTIAWRLRRAVRTDAVGTRPSNLRGNRLPVAVARHCKVVICCDVPREQKELRVLLAVMSHLSPKPKIKGSGRAQLRSSSDSLLVKCSPDPVVLGVRRTVVFGSVLSQRFLTTLASGKARRSLTHC